MKSITTGVVKKVDVKLPVELAKNENLKDCKIDVCADLITVTLPVKSMEGKVFFEIWQYVNDKQIWVKVTMA
jgi:hypothetical protein